MLTSFVVGVGVGVGVGVVGVVVVVVVVVAAENSKHVPEHQLVDHPIVAEFHVAYLAMGSFPLHGLRRAIVAKNKSGMYSIILTASNRWSNECVNVESVARHLLSQRI